MNIINIFPKNTGGERFARALSCFSKKFLKTLLIFIAFTVYIRVIATEDILSQADRAFSEEMPSPFDVSQETAYAYPVPFEPAKGHSKITFDRLPDQGFISVYSSAGLLVKKLAFSSPVDGKLDWDAANEDGEKIAADVYLYLIESSSARKKGKLLVIR